MSKRTPQASPKTRVKKSREEIRELIVAEASRMFAERGYIPPTLREITKAAGVSMPVVYWFFSDKRELYKYCCTSVVERDIRRLDEAVAGLTDPTEIIFSTVATSCDIHLNHGATRVIHRLLLGPVYKVVDV